MIADSPEESDRKSQEEDRVIGTLNRLKKPAVESIGEQRQKGENRFVERPQQKHARPYREHQEEPHQSEHVAREVEHRPAPEHSEATGNIEHQ